jgi:hypothetical protein
LISRLRKLNDESILAPATGQPSWKDWKVDTVWKKVTEIEMNVISNLSLSISHMPMPSAQRIGMPKMTIAESVFAVVAHCTHNDFN